MTSSTQISAKDLSSKWAKFSDSEASAIKNVEALTAQVVKTYGRGKIAADAEVKAFMVGRTF
jgi:hypothetical protein